jgi:2-keto-4-pentenoate hydratase/2-oxohepta-3-ene-1,7-dioic acid hydratase in catechol pathway
MRLVRLGSVGSETPAVLDREGRPRDVSGIVEDFNASFFASGGMAKLRDVDLEDLPILSEDLRVGAPIARPGNLVAVGLNYADHAREANMEIPTEPLLFNKAPNTVIGPYDNIHFPRGGHKVDWEVELGIVIGSTCRYLDSPQEALSCIAGFVAIDDVSERAFQAERGGQWVKGKAFETSCPTGPWLVTPDDSGIPEYFDLWLDVNGERRQTGSTSNLIFDVGTVLHYISQVMVLDPGDLVITGTPPGVGMGMAEPTWLKVGDVVTLGISGLGEQRTQVIAAP